MKAALIVSLLAVAAAASETTRWNLPSKEGVSVLSDNNFNDVITKHSLVFVMFTSPDCPHCKAAQPELIKLAGKFDAEAKDVVIAELDIRESPAVTQKYAVTAYPTFKLFYHGTPIDYSLGRSEKQLSAWLNQRLKVRTPEITDLETYRKFSDAKLSAVLYLSKKNKKVLNSFGALAATRVKIPFAYTYLDDVQTDLGVTGDFALGVFRKFDDGRKVLSTNDLTYEVMLQFIDSVRMPALPELSEEIASDILGNHKTSLILHTSSADTEAFKVVEQLAKSKAHNIVFAWTNLSTPFSKRVGELVGLTEHHKEQVRLVKFGESGFDKFKLESVTESSLAKFIEDFKAGKLSQFRKSDPSKPETHKVGHVWEVTGNDFEQLVLSSPKTVLLTIYSNNCKHCDEALKLMDKLAAQLTVHPEIVLARINWSTNEHPALHIDALPSLKLFKKGHKSEPVEFHGVRSFYAITSFLHREIGASFKKDLLIDDESL